MRWRVMSLASVGSCVVLVAGAVATAQPAAAAPIPPGVGTPAVEYGAPSTEMSEELFEVGADHRVVHWHYVAGVVMPEDLGGYAVGGVSATQLGALVWDTVEVVAVRGADGAVWLRERPAGGRWTWWHSLGGRTGAHPAVTSFYVDGVPCLLVLVRGTDGAMWERVKGTSGWTGWRRVGGILTSSPAASGLGAAVRGRDGQVWMATRAAGLYGGWSNWTRAPSLPAGLRVASEPGLDATFGFLIYVRGSDGAGWRLWQMSGEWQSLGGLFTSSLFAVSHFDGVLGDTFVYWRGLNGRLYEKHWTDPWHLLGG